MLAIQIEKLKEIKVGETVYVVDLFEQPKHGDWVVNEKDFNKPIVFQYNEKENIEGLKIICKK